MKHLALSLLISASLLTVCSESRGNTNSDPSKVKKGETLLPGWEEWVAEFEKDIRLHSNSLAGVALKAQQRSCKIVLSLRWDKRIIGTTVADSENDQRLANIVHLFFDSMPSIPEPPREPNFDRVEIVGTLECREGTLAFKVQTMRRQAEAFNKFKPEVDNTARKAL